MNKRIFITYGDDLYRKSLRRICDEARQCGEFDEVIAYTNADLPENITSHELFSYRRGGGYWLWKPFVCLATLERCDDTDIVVYSDCGNKIFKHRQWSRYWQWMRKWNMVTFYNGGRMGHWSRRALIDAYTQEVPMIKGMCQLSSGFIIFKKEAMGVIKEWLSTMMEHPNYVIDADDKMKAGEYQEFIESRHDQAVLSAVVYRHCAKGDSILVTRQRSERYSRRGQAVFNARISDNMARNPMSKEPLHIWAVRHILVIPLRKLRMWWCMRINKAKGSK